MARKLKSDKWLFMATLLLVCASLVMVYSASAVVSSERNQPASFYLVKQLVWALTGLCLLPIVMRIDYRSYRQPSIVCAILAVTLVGLVAVLFGRPINGARRWLNLGPLGVQPSELAKIAIIVFTAALLERRMDRINEPRHALLPLGLIVGACTGLILLEPDFGTAVSIGAVVAVMVFSAGISYRYVLGLMALAVPALYLLTVLAEYRMRRLTAFLVPWGDPLDSGFQLIQSLIAVGTGGLTGRGLMNGVQKLFFLPEPHNDFIFSVIAEELGLIGATVVVLCFCVIVWRGLRTALRAPKIHSCDMEHANLPLRHMFDCQPPRMSVIPNGAPLHRNPIEF
jgi:cell division protein FtsW